MSVSPVLSHSLIFTEKLRVHVLLFMHILYRFFFFIDVSLAGKASSKVIQDILLSEFYTGVAKNY